MRWWMLIHQLPPRPLYLRARIRHSLSRVGAVAVKNAVYALPRTEECLEGLRQIAAQAVAGGGEAFLCEAQFLDRAVEEALVRESREARDAEYEDIARSLAGAQDPAAIARARRRFEKIVRIDFFGSEGRGRVDDLLRKAVPRRRRGRAPAREPLAAWKDRTWTTRRGLHIDRIACAWLIRRFIDSKARFRFIDPQEPARPGEVRFDMPGGDFTHEGDRCTFETLLERTGVGGRGLDEIAQIVHDVDLKDGKFGRPEAAGVERLVIGLILETPKDADRLDRGLALFDGLYRSFGAAGVLSREKK
ncbi:MAG: chromate resistance protein [Acidobacteriota bacterium]|nr:chromate resistance protein [Acidobacteriota bacterium]